MAVIPDDSPLILVCDDDSMQRLLIRQCLESEGMRILEAKDGYEALELVANNAPDFVVMDVDMPGISGIETCRRLRARDDGTDVPVLIVTGADDQETIDLGFEEARESGMNDVLVKPFSAVDLRRMLLNYVNVASSKAQESDDRVLIKHDTLIAIARINAESSMDLVDQVVSLFEQQVPGYINELEMATREQNAGDTRRVAHAFKSSAMNIGANVLG